ncbi:MAG TPA: SCP2 sterol-binding domain-containing protein [Albidovulum sp.]|uniref:SCP2 sterol-binding domain-containing protein n=1 Tax=Albidovulum sp. TaxID=1872424 RepID=UPI002BD38CE1|nr:SCP2 sterol-binding domain-containing protein [Albidovulum sp.]
MPLEPIAADIRRALETKAFNGSLTFDCGADGVIVLADGTASTVPQPTDCTLTISRENLQSLLKGKLNPMMALATGKLKLSGDMKVAMGLAKLLS